MTGTLYMFRGQIDGYVYTDLKRIETRLAPMALIADTLDAQPGTAGDGPPEITPKVASPSIWTSINDPTALPG